MVSSGPVLIPSIIATPTITREKETDNNADLKTIIRGPVKELELKNKK